MNQILPAQKKNLKNMDAMKFADVAETIFAPIYPVIANQIMSNTSICSGVALDIGTGPGHLATALAKASELTVHALDLSPEMLTICDVSSMPISWVVSFRSEVMSPRFRSLMEHLTSS